MPTMELLDVVELLSDMPEHGLMRGEVGTIVEELSPTAVLLEFADADGCTTALVAANTDELRKVSS